MDLWSAFDSIPRLTLAQTPTPLEHLPRLSRAVGREIFIKRDDVLGPALGGNKTRKLEYLLADAQQHGAKKVVTFGGLQSNHARLTAATCAALGLEAHLFYFAKRPRVFTGNLLCNHLLGSRMHFIPFDGNNSQDMSLETTNNLVKLLARLIVGKNYFIPVGGHNVLGCLGYVRAARELHTQLQAQQIKNARVVLAAGTGGTLSGLLAGFKLLDSSTAVLGIDIGKLWKGFAASLAQLATDLTVYLQRPHSFAAQDVPLLEDRYVGQGYAIPNEKTFQAMRQLASLEGIVLDPIYTGKAFAGMLDLIARDELPKDQPLIFLHTGGFPGLFA